MSQHATYGRDGGAVDVAAVERDAVEQALRKRADVRRILADDEMLEFAHGRLGGFDETVERALAEAHEAGVGVDVDEEEILPARADGEGFDPGDFHGRRN